MFRPSVVIHFVAHFNPEFCVSPYEINAVRGFLFWTLFSLFSTAQTGQFFPFALPLFFSNFQFSQICGYKRVSRNPLKVSLCLPSIYLRRAALQSFRNRKPYQRQKSKLQHELESCLYFLPTPKSLCATSPQDVTRFLVWKDRKEKTKVHIPACKLFGTRSAVRCTCLTTLSAGTVDNLIGKWRSLFVDLGRGGLRLERALRRQQSCLTSMY